MVGRLLLAKPIIYRPEISAYTLRLIARLMQQMKDLHFLKNVIIKLKRSVCVR
jgi:hypothetical protein